MLRYRVTIEFDTDELLEPDVMDSLAGSCAVQIESLSDGDIASIAYENPSCSWEWALRPKKSH